MYYLCVAIKGGYFLKNKKIIITILLSMTLLFGCGINEENSEVTTENKEITFHTIVSENAIPKNFFDIAFKRETPPHFFYLIKKAEHQETFEENWKLYRIKNRTPKVNFNESIVLFLTVFESGSCPSVIDHMTLNDDTLIVTVSMSKNDDIKNEDIKSKYFKKEETFCFMNARPKTFIIQTNKNILENIKNISIIEYGTTTTIPL